MLQRFNEISDDAQASLSETTGARTGLISCTDGGYIFFSRYFFGPQV